MWKFKFRSQNLEKIANFFFKFSNFCFYCHCFNSYTGDSDFVLSVKGVSVGIEDLQVYCIYYKLNILPARVVWNWNSHLLSCCFLTFFFSSHSALWKSACDFVPSHSNCSSSCGWGVSLLSYQTDKAKVNWNTNFWQEKLFFRLSILYYKLNQVGYLTNTFHFSVKLQLSVTDVSPHFVIICDLLLTRQTD